MFAHIRDFPEQVREAIAIGTSAPLRLPVKRIRQIVLCGMGGSAIGGDLLRSYSAGELGLPFLINRAYTLPAFVGPDTLVIVASYSGGTEEAIACHREALRRKAPVLCITAGGGTEKLARSRKSPVIKIPGGLPPRAALGYAFFPLLLAFIRLGLLKDRPRDLRETLRMLDEKSHEYGKPDLSSNRALQLASRLRSRLAVVYSSSERLDAVNTRWRCQVAENAKTLMFGNLFPEMNHNELVGWKVLGPVMRETEVLFLRDRSDHPRVQHRIELTKGIIARYTPRVTEIWSEGTSLLARMFSLIALGDWVSFYLAILNGEDPTPIEVIDYLKHELSEI